MATAIAISGWWLLTILRRTPNIPFTDEWSWAELSIAIRRGDDVFPLLLAVHNGHRNIVGSLIFLAIDRLSGWNVVLEDALGLAFVAIGLVSFRLFVTRTLPPVSRDLVFAFGALVIAGGQAYENFLIGYNIDWQICTAAAFIMTDRLCAGGRMNAVFAAVVVTVASFSSAQGLLLWLAGGVVLELVQRRVAIGVWGVASISCMTVFFAGYHTEGQGALQAHDLNDFRHFLDILLATPMNVHFETFVVEAVGMATLASVVILVIIASIARVPGAKMAGWLGHQTYGLPACVMTAFLRAGGGPEQAFSPRYESLSAFLMIAVVGLGAQLVERSNDVRVSVVAGSLALALCVWAFSASQWASVIAISTFETQRVQEIQALRSRDELKITQLAYPNIMVLDTWLRELDEVGDDPLRRFP